MTIFVINLVKATCYYKSRCSEHLQVWQYTLRNKWYNKAGPQHPFCSWKFQLPFTLSEYLYLWSPCTGYNYLLSSSLVVPTVCPLSLKLWFSLFELNKWVYPVHGGDIFNLDNLAYIPALCNTMLLQFFECMNEGLIFSPHDVVSND